MRPILTIILVGFMLVGVAGTTTIGNLSLNAAPSPSLFTVVDDGTSNTWKATLSSVVSQAIGSGGILKGGNGISTTGSTISLAPPVSIANGGTGSGTQNFVDLTSAQTINGTKTFAQPTAFTSATMSGLIKSTAGAANNDFEWDCANGSTLCDLAANTGAYVSGVTGSVFCINNNTNTAAGSYLCADVHGNLGLGGQLTTSGGATPVTIGGSCNSNGTFQMCVNANYSALYPVSATQRFGVSNAAGNIANLIVNDNGSLDMLGALSSGNYTLPYDAQSSRDAAAEHIERGTIAFSAASSGTKNFAVGFTAAPTCTASQSGATPLAIGDTNAATTTAITVTLTAASTTTYSYICIGS